MLKTDAIGQSERITLYYTEGSSDKVYQAAIEPSGGGFVVNIAYGRRGSTFQTGCKTQSPVDYAAAKKVYDKLVQEKTDKGYSPGEDGTPYQHTEKEQRSTGVLPQLLNAIEEDAVQKLLADTDWWAQEKFDGRRLLIQRKGDEVVGINRRGLSIALPGPVAEDARTLSSGQWIMDGEAVGDAYFAFDLFESARADLRPQSYSKRFEALTKILVSRPSSAIKLVATATTSAAKKKLFLELQINHREGIVLKRHAAPHVVGRPNSGGDWLKLKFTARASCIVASVNRGKRSVALDLLHGKDRVGIGSVTIPASQPVPLAGSIVEVRYLYAYPGGALFQPVYLCRRDDLGTEACTIGQLKLKPAGGEDES